MSQTKTGTPAGKPDQQKEGWHRHPAFIAMITALGAIVSAALAIFLGQTGALPSSINPAPAPTTIFATETVTATSTVTQTVTESPTTGPDSPSTTPTVETPPPGSLAITVELGRNGKIGPDEYRAGSFPHAAAVVYDETGKYLTRGCYLTWELKRGSTVIKSTRTETCGGTTFYFQPGYLEVAGIYQLSVSGLTDAGAKGTKAVQFKVI
ncbi:hypothetical protein [Kribbella sp. NPDC050470]|uniref:hypothetical protein n=1 Tax=unclassified Kribbella TaxID=2644121 RepID=UPI00378898E4